MSLFKQQQVLKAAILQCNESLLK